MLRSDLPPNIVERLSGQVDQLRQAASNGHTEAWIAGVDHSVTRAALLLCDDLETAAKLVVDDPMTVPGSTGFNPTAQDQ